jgi:hypothetical protein
MAARYGKEVMVVEVGGLYSLVENTYDMLVAVIQKVVAVPDKMGLGVIYWEPEGEKSWSGYSLSCWNAGGKPTRALNAFLYDVSTGVDDPVRDSELIIYPNPSPDGIFKLEMKDRAGFAEIKIYDIQGRLVKEQSFISLSKVTLDTGLKEGIYLIRICGLNGDLVRKILVGR